jgi:hypothetical protein
LSRSVERRRLSQQLDQFFMDDLDDGLRRREALHHLRADGARLDLLDELLDDLVVDVGFEQRQAHLAHGGVDIALGQLAFAGKAVKDTLQFVGKALKHESAPND